MDGNEILKSQTSLDDLSTAPNLAVINRHVKIIFQLLSYFFYPYGMSVHFRAISRSGTTTSRNLVSFIYSIFTFQRRVLVNNLWLGSLPPVPYPSAFSAFVPLSLPTPALHWITPVFRFRKRNRNLGVWRAVAKRIIFDHFLFRGRK